MNDHQPPHADTIIAPFGNGLVFRREGNAWVPDGWDPEAEAALAVLAGDQTFPNSIAFVVEAARLAIPLGWTFTTIALWDRFLTGEASKGVWKRHLARHHLPDVLLPYVLHNEKQAERYVDTVPTLTASTCEQIVDLFPDMRKYLRVSGRTPHGAIFTVMEDLGPDGEAADYGRRWNNKAIQRDNDQIFDVLRLLAGYVDADTLEKIVRDDSYPPEDRVLALTGESLGLDDRARIIDSLHGQSPELAGPLITSITHVGLTVGDLMAWLGSFPDSTVLGPVALSALPWVLQSGFFFFNHRDQVMDFMAQARVIDQRNFLVDLVSIVTDLGDLLEYIQPDWYPGSEGLVGPRFRQRLARYGTYRDWVDDLNFISDYAERIGLPLRPAIPALTVHPDLPAALARALRAQGNDGQWGDWILDIADLLVLPDSQPTQQHLDEIESVEGWDKGKGAKHRKILHGLLVDEINGS